MVNFAHGWLTPNTAATVLCFALLAVSVYFALRDLLQYAARETADEPAHGSRNAKTHEPRGGGKYVSGCDPVTSSPMLATDSTGRLRRACRCHWPALFGQSDLFSDCDVQRACDGGEGALVHKVTGRPLTEATHPVRIHDYVCSACSRCNVPGKDPHTGLPSCVPRAFNDRDRDMCIYDAAAAVSDTDVEDGESRDSGGEGDFRTTKPMLSVGSRFVSKKYVSMLTDRARNTAWAPNPCAFDLFTGARLGGGCELRMTRKSGVAYCAPTKDNIMTAVKEDTYLANNRGRYPNACFRFTSNEEHVNGYVIEYFLRRRQGVELPSPVVSMRVAKGMVLNSVLSGLGLSGEPDKKMLLFTQPEPPADVSEFPHPFNERRMAEFKKEVNDWIEYLPAKCAHYSVVGLITPILYNCSAPVQPLLIPECSQIGESDRRPTEKDELPAGSWIGDQTEAYAKTTVACTKPKYDPRFPLVPNYNVSVGSTNADPVSAVLFFNTANNTVYPHWKGVGYNSLSGELEKIKRYTREKLLSAPNE